MKSKPAPSWRLLSPPRLNRGDTKLIYYLVRYLTHKRMLIMLHNAFQFTKTKSLALITVEVPFTKVNLQWGMYITRDLCSHKVYKVKCFATCRCFDTKYGAMSYWAIADNGRACGPRWLANSFSWTGSGSCKKTTHFPTFRRLWPQVQENRELSLGTRTRLRHVMQVIFWPRLQAP